MHTSLIQKCPLNAFPQKNISFSDSKIKKPPQNGCFGTKIKDADQLFYGFVWRPIWRSVGDTSSIYP